MRIAIVIGHEEADVTADDFGARIAEKPLGFTIEALDDSLVVDDHNAVDRGIEQCLQLQ